MVNKHDEQETILETKKTVTGKYVVQSPEEANKLSISEKIGITLRGLSPMEIIMKIVTTPFILMIYSFYFAKNFIGAVIAWVALKAGLVASTFILLALATNIFHIIDDNTARSIVESVGYFLFQQMNPNGQFNFSFLPYPTVEWIIIFILAIGITYDDLN